MLIRRMTANFGKLQGETLELNDGLNIIQAPNETGKSTWCAFMLAMLYGINSRERDKAGFPADKNRYTPWSGTAMSGRLDCQAQGQDITLMRTTKRATAPMGEFQAFYTNTADAVPDITAALCGEQLLGVTREVYARSAFIRQNSLGITQNAELERRISSLLSSGEESTSYSEAADALKKQLHQRRHKHTGRIPALESELQQLQMQAADAEALTKQIASLHQQEHTLHQEEVALRQELECLSTQEENQARLLSESKATADRALRHADMLRQQLEADHIPESETIARLRGAIVNLSTSRHTLKKVREARDEAMKELLLAETAVSKNPFAGQTAPQAKKFVEDIAAPLAPAGEDLIWQVVLGALLILLSAFLLTLGNAPAAWLEVKYFGIPAGLFAIIHPFYRRHRRKHSLNRILEKHGVSTIEDLRTLANTYTELVAARDDAQAEADKRTADADTLYNNISTNEQAILLEIRRFAPSAHDLSTADALLRGCAIRRKELATAEQAARTALSQQDTVQMVQADAIQSTCPAKDKLHIKAELARITDNLSICRKTIHHLTGQLSTVGDASQLRANIEATEQQLRSLQDEYNSLQLALTALDSANQTLQNRFAPALGRRTAELFNYLTQGQYQGVVLDRNFRLAAEPTENHIYRDVSLLSAGAADQLYLAARLAICEAVLPPEKNAPLILDDALVNFDDERCAIALRLLKAISKHRQILLFTCHSREAAFFSEDKEVTILRLTNRSEKV